MIRKRPTVSEGMRWRGSGNAGGERGRELREGTVIPVLARSKTGTDGGVAARRRRRGFSMFEYRIVKLDRPGLLEG